MLNPTGLTNGRYGGPPDHYGGPPMDAYGGGGGAPPMEGAPHPPGTPEYAEWVQQVRSHLDDSPCISTMHDLSQHIVPMTHVSAPLWP